MGKYIKDESMFLLIKTMRKFGYTNCSSAHEHLKKNKVDGYFAPCSFCTSAFGSSLCTDSTDIGYTRKTQLFNEYFTQFCGGQLELDFGASS